MDSEHLLDVFTAKALAEDAKKLADVTADVCGGNNEARCPYCKQETEVLFMCVKCKRIGCYNCMPIGPESTCPECEREGRRRDENG